MRDLWIGMCTDEYLKKHIIENNGKILSASVSQDNIVDGLIKNGVVFDTINSFRVPAYPSYKEKKITEYCWQENGTENIEVGYLNLKYIGLYFKKLALKKAARNWAKNHKGTAPNIYVYSMHSPFMAAASEVKRILPDAKIIQIVPDLPQYMNLSPSRLTKILKKIDWIGIKGLMKSVDKYVLYSKHMAEFLGLEDEKWMVMEGTVNLKDQIDFNDKIQKQKAIMYSGVCDLKYGIPELLEAFSKVKDPSVELWISGAGNAKELIEECAKTDKRINYLGFLPSREDLLIKQKSAYALINVRKPTEEASRYCFPSKIFEYMLSGNPVLSFKIEGIPDEYFDHLIEMKSQDPDEMAKTIEHIINLPDEERETIGRKSYEFVVNNKNNVAQTEKIIGFVNQ